jgi:hypothetical protein
MRRILFTLALLLTVGSAHAQVTIQQPLKIKRYTLASNFNLNGVAASAGAIVATTNLVDSTSYTVAASPDVCRLVDLTMTDANSSITAGIVTVVGTDCLGYARTCTFDFGVVATRGSGVKTLSVTNGVPGSGCYLSTVATVSNGALTGEDAGTDKIAAGYSTAPSNGWQVFGTLMRVGNIGEHGVDVTKGTLVGAVVTTSGSLSTTLTSVGSNGSFTNVAVGDLLQIPLYGTTYERRVTARGSSNSITLNAAINIPAAGVVFEYKKAYFSTDPSDNMWVPVDGARSVAFEWAVNANADTGGVIALLECLPANTPTFPASDWVTIATTTTASGSAQVPTVGPSSTQPYVVDLTLAPFAYCRFGLKFGTNDDGDGAPEDINVAALLNK